MMMATMARMAVHWRRRILHAAASGQSAGSSGAASSTSATGSTGSTGSTSSPGATRSPGATAPYAAHAASAGHAAHGMNLLYPNAANSNLIIARSSGDFCPLNVNFDTRLR